VNYVVENKEIEELLVLEKRFQHGYLNYGLSTVEEIVEKVNLVLQLMDTCQLKKMEDSEEALLLKDMLRVNLLSPEVAGKLLIDYFPDHGFTGTLIEKTLLDKSYLDYCIYCGVYYKTRHDLLADLAKRHLDQLNHYSSLNDNAMTIQKFYGERYASRSENQWFTGKGAVYTIITGGYDELVEPAFINEDWDYYCFTDTPERFQSNVWKIVKLDTDIQGPLISQREVKMKPYVYLPEYDYTIYLDGKMGIQGDLTRYIKAYSKESSMLCFPHPVRRTLIEEVKAIIYYGKADPSQIQNQVDTYMQEGYQDQNLIAETACLVRSNRDDRLKRVMEDWFDEIKTKSHRDQLSLGYVCWKNQYEFDVCDLNIYSNIYLIHHGHK